MEVLIIGNGFDLEHDLPTSYKEFLEFCRRVKRIYTYSRESTLGTYVKNSLADWEINTYIKEKLANAFENRSYGEIQKEDGSYYTGVVTPDKILNELFLHIQDNTWISYFLECSSRVGENWIDFEKEISNVIQIFDEVRKMTKNGESITDIQKEKSEILTMLLKASKTSLQNVFKNIKVLDDFIAFLNTELDRLIRALEIYISGFVAGITVKRKSTDIDHLNPDYILSFNYSDTYRRVYGKEKSIEYSYIHGKADITQNISTCNLVLGIDEYLDDTKKDKELEFLTFKKFYQRVYKSTDNNYLEWIDEIRAGYREYVEKERTIYAEIVEAIKDGSFCGFPFQDNVYKEFSNRECPVHTLYIFGHSLDVTDKDILKLFICNDNVHTKIFYHRKNCNDKENLGKLIKNLIQIVGQEELIRRTGGICKTIEFIPQTLCEDL